MQRGATKRVPVPVRHRGRGSGAASGVQHDRVPAGPVRPAARDPGRAGPTGSARRTSTATWRSSTPGPAERPCAPPGRSTGRSRPPGGPRGGAAARSRFCPTTGSRTSSSASCTGSSPARAPGVTVIDITHQIPAHDVRAGALTLWRAAPWLAPGVILAVVDPGVGTGPPGRRHRGGRRRRRAGRPRQRTAPPRRHLPRSPHRRRGAAPRRRLPGGAPPSPGGTSSPRPRADLATGADLDRLGPPHRPGRPGRRRRCPSPYGRPGRRAAGRGAVGRPLRQRPAQRPPGRRRPPRARRRPARRAPTPGRPAGSRPTPSSAPAEVGLVTDSYGLLAVSCRGASAAARIGLAPGDEVWLRARPRRLGPAARRYHLRHGIAPGGYPKPPSPGCRCTCGPSTKRPGSGP